MTLSKTKSFTLFILVIFFSFQTSTSQDCLVQRATHIVATTSALYGMTPHRKTQILKGAFYGITLYKNGIYIFENLKSISGRIIKLNPLLKPIPVINDLNPGCHQIDIIDDKLYIADTYNNRILVYSLDSYTLLDSYYPLGQLLNGRKSDNYAHINSIFSKDGKFYIMAHNETHKTNKPSVIYVCNKDFKIIDAIEINANSAHNIVLHNGDLWYCDSLHYTVVKNGKIVLKYNNLSRGLSITDDIIAIGESTYGARKQRSALPGWVNFYDPDLNLISRQEVEGLVSEIRALYAKDYSLSATNT